MKFRYLFGPVPSRRLGISLGVDIIPKKVCSMDCVYCEVGGTTKLTMERMEYVPASKIIDEIDTYMKEHPAPDYITFSGSGEPTLNIRFGEILRYIKKSFPGVRVAVLTNGSLLSLPEVRHEMMPADLVMPSLDAATYQDFVKINRPARGLVLEDYIAGIEAFAADYQGILNLEILFLEGYNDDKESLDKLKEAVLRINPHAVQLNTLDRPGTIEGLKPMPDEKMKAIMDYWQLPNVEIIAKAVSRKDLKAYRTDAETAIYQTVKRRPCTLDDLIAIVGMNVSEINKYLDVLENKGKIYTSREKRGVFYRAR